MGLSDKDWNLFMLEAEEEHFGLTRIVTEHNALRRRCEELESDYRKTRKILAFIPARMVIEAKEKAGYPNFIHACSTEEKGPKIADWQMWVVLYCTGESESVRSETWPSDMIRENLTEHYMKRGCEVLAMERAGVVVNTMEFLRKRASNE